MINQSLDGVRVRNKFERLIETLSEEMNRKLLNVSGNDIAKALNEIQRERETKTERADDETNN
jgi:hypothetical protein